MANSFMNRKTTAGLLALASCLWIAGSTPAAQSRSLGIMHVSVIDATGSTPKRDQAVVVTGDRIVAIGGSNRVRVPAGAELRTRGVDFIKVGDTLTRDAYFAIAQESRRLGVPFVGHLSPSVTAFEAARAGQRSLEHFGSAGLRNVLVACSREEADLDAYLQEALAGFLAGGESPDAKVYRAEFTRRLVDSYDDRKAATLFALFVKNGTWQVPTFVALRDVWTSTKSKLSPEEVAAGERVSQKTIEMVAAMRRAGVKVLAGSDLTIRNGVPLLHEELLALVSVGMTPMAAPTAEYSSTSRRTRRS